MRTKRRRNMFLRVSALTIALLIAMLSASCGKFDPDKLPPVSSPSDYMRMTLTYHASRQKTEPIGINASVIGRFDLIEEAGVELPEGAPAVIVYDMEGNVLSREGFKKNDISNGIVKGETNHSIDASAIPDGMSGAFIVSFGWLPDENKDDPKAGLFIANQLVLWYYVRGDVIGFSPVDFDEADYYTRSGIKGIRQYSGHAFSDEQMHLHLLSPTMGSADRSDGIELVFALVTPYHKDSFTYSPYAIVGSGLEVSSCEIKTGGEYPLLCVSFRAEEGYWTDDTNEIQEIKLCVEANTGIDEMGGCITNSGIETRISIYASVIEGKLVYNMSEDVLESGLFLYK